MEVSRWIVYWWTRLDAVSSFLGWMTVALVVGLAVYGLVWLCSKVFGHPIRCKGLAVALAVSAVVASAAHTLVPSKKDMAAIVIVPAVANSKFVGNVMSFLNASSDRLNGLMKEKAKEEQND